jgi:riboflavin synthase
MFTGIIQEIGTIKQVVKKATAMVLTIVADEIINSIKLGDSVAVNGVCLTVTKIGYNWFMADVVPETFVTTSLQYCRPSSKVNLELALTLTTRLGGHFVSGHIDGIGTITKVLPQQNAIVYDIKVHDASLLRFCVKRGSIAVDGASLTIMSIAKQSISISLIPHTVKNTVLGFKQVGKIVNIECDMLAKFTGQLLKNGHNVTKSESAITTNRTGGCQTKLDNQFLLQCGFL